MTPEERNLVTQLFDRLATLEDAPRDPDAERLIQDGLRQAPNATYALVQTALVQDEALKRADARIRELETQLGVDTEPPPQGGFLDSMRKAWGDRPASGGGERPASGLGDRTPPRAGSVPTVRPGDEPAPPSGAAAAYGQPTGFMGGGSFLGTAGAAAAGMIGGSLLLSGIRSMMGHHGGAKAASSPTGLSGDLSSPGSGGGGDLARQAGLDDIGRGSSREDTGHGLVGDDAANNDDFDDDPGGFDDDGGGDDGGGDDGGGE